MHGGRSLGPRRDAADRPAGAGRAGLDGHRAHRRLDAFAPEGGVFADVGGQEQGVELADTVLRHFRSVPAPAQCFGGRGKEHLAQLCLARLEAGDFGAEFGEFVGGGEGMHGRLHFCFGKGSQGRVKKV